MRKDLRRQGRVLGGKEKEKRRIRTYNREVK